MGDSANLALSFTKENVLTAFCVTFVTCVRQGRKSAGIATGLSRLRHTGDRTKIGFGVHCCTTNEIRNVAISECLLFLRKGLLNRVLGVLTFHKIS